MHEHGLAKEQLDVEMLFAYVKRRTKNEPRFQSSIAEMYAYNARRANWFVRVAVTLLGLLRKPKHGAIRYFFWGTKFDEIILGLPSESVCVVGGPKQLLFCLRNRRTFLPNMKLWKPLSKVLTNSQHPFPVSIFFDEISKTGKRLSHHAHQDAVFVVDNDSLPIQRAMIISARQAGLIPVCVQHGLFQSKSPGYIIDGWFADKLFVINEAQKRMLHAKGMPVDKMKVMGFHSSFYTPVRPVSPPGERAICFLGQPWGKYSEELKRKYLYIVAGLYAWGKREGVEVFYKPHPWEVGEDYLDDLTPVVHVPLNKALEDYDVFISITSTALIEAAAAERVAIQLRDDAFDADDLSADYQIFSVHVSPDGNWKQDLREFINRPIINAASNPPPAREFLRSLSDIFPTGNR